MKQVLDCKSVRDKKLLESKAYIDTLEHKPRLLVIQVGDRSDSNRYIKNKINRCEEVGIKCTLLKLEEDISEGCLINYIKSMQSQYHSLIIQSPLPSHINEQNVMNTIDYRKDCDGLGQTNIGLLHSGNPNIVPATAQGILDLLDACDCGVTGMNIMLIGRSKLVNKPLQELLCQRNATVTLCHSKTRCLHKMLKSGDYDMVIGAIGKHNYLKNVNTKYIIDVGINVLDDGKLGGDFDISTCSCRYYTPVPSGVGLTTTSAVITNILKCYKLHN